MSGIDLRKLTISSALNHMSKGDFSAEDLAMAYVDVIDKENPEINAYIRKFDSSFEMAKIVDQKRRNGEPLGRLAGIPLGIKDAILVKGEVATSASKILEGHKAVYDSTVVSRLRLEDAVFLGSTNMDEFAMGSSTQTSAYGVCRNPVDKTRVPGGSSGGSCAAVAADMALAAIGSDTASSVRQPASFCGVVGMKTTYGSVSRYGLIAMTSSLDQIGPVTKNVEDSELIFDIISGKDQMDSTSIPFEKRNSKDVNKDDVVVGIPVDYPKDGVDEDVIKNFEESIEKIKSLGYKTAEIKMPHMKYSLASYYLFMPAEVSANLARFDGMRYGLHVEGSDLLGDYMKTRGEGFGKEVRRRIILGTYVLSAGYYDAYYNKAMKVRDLITKDFDEAYKTVNAILLPTTPEPAFKIGEKMDDPVKMYLQDVFTVPANISEVPCISVPSGFVKRDGVDLPLGLQIMAPRFREDICFKVGRDFEKITNE